MPDAGWVAADALVSDDGPLDEMVAAVAHAAGIDHPPLGAEWLLEHHAWQGASLTAAAMMSGWVPDLAPGNVLVQFREGAIWGIALRGGMVRKLPDEPALVRAGHHALVAHLTPLIDALAARRLRTRRALWRAAGDRVAQACLWCAEAFSDADRATRLATRMIAPPSPLHVPLRTASGEDGTPFHVRASCCLYHRVPGAELCPGCPLRRSRRARAAG
ncbi:MAG: (2Fe-2S)-binding protein [Solirubrobacteraceae bacterium]